MERVYISSLLKENQEFNDHFTELLKNNDIEPVELEYTKDIWCRDYMPVKSSEGKCLLFNYDPEYLREYEKKNTPRVDIKKMLNQLGIVFTDIPEIKLDGGNVVQFADRVIMTDAIFRENGVDKRDKTGQAQLLGKVKNYLNSEIIIIPHQPDDPLSHSDGVVRFLDRDTVLVNNFSSVTNPQLIESKHYLDNLFGALGKAGLNIIQIPYAPINEIGKDDMPVAYGIYINYLETSECVFLPQFQEECVEKDKEALQIFSEIFMSIEKRVIPVNSRSIAYGGGVLNCITWN